MTHFYWGPTLEQCEDMLQVSFWFPMEKVLPLLDAPSTEIYKKIVTTLNNFPHARALFDCLEEEYVRLFISDRQGIRAPLYASCYVTEEPGERSPLMGEPAQAMKERFESKELSLADDVGEPPDHLSIELEYLYFLLEKGWVEDEAPLLKEAGQFASEIMLPWVGQLQQRLEAIETENQFYPLITTLLSAFLKMIGEIKEGV
ncbi:MAG: molecular chaperone TorD family protein [Deltaproteobacteria bacterium]|nr:molecular chaperone TorD family protein [Deltaproteobacteria bacterium]